MASKGQKFRSYSAILKQNCSNTLLSFFYCNFDQIYPCFGCLENFWVRWRDSNYLNNTLMQIIKKVVADSIRESMMNTPKITPEQLEEEIIDLQEDMLKLHKRKTKGLASPEPKLENIRDLAEVLNVSVDAVQHDFDIVASLINNL